MYVVQVNDFSGLQEEKRQKKVNKIAYSSSLAECLKV
jgi:hypothetical protein